MIKEWTKGGGYYANLYEGKVPVSEEMTKMYGSTPGNHYSKYVIVKWRNKNFFRLRMIIDKDYGENWDSKEFRITNGFSPRTRYTPELKDVRDFKTLKAAKAYAEELEAKGDRNETAE